MMTSNRRCAAKSVVSTHIRRSHKEDFTIARSASVSSQILIRAAANPTPAQVSAAQKKAEMIRARAAKGDELRRSRARLFGRRFKSPTAAN